MTLEGRLEDLFSQGKSHFPRAIPEWKCVGKYIFISSKPSCKNCLRYQIIISKYNLFISSKPSYNHLTINVLLYQNIISIVKIFQRNSIVSFVFVFLKMYIFCPIVANSQEFSFNDPLLVRDKAIMHETSK